MVSAWTKKSAKLFSLILFSYYLIDEMGDDKNGIFKNFPINRFNCVILSAFNFTIERALFISFERTASILERENFFLLFTAKRLLSVCF